MVNWTTQSKLCGTGGGRYASTSPQRVAAAVIIRDGKMLVCRRPAHKVRGNMWEFAGGKLEPGESREDALIRECREELGVGLRVGAVLDETTYCYPDTAVSITFMSAEIIDGEPQNLEHEEIAWVTADEAADMDFCPADRDFLETLKRKGCI